MRDMDIKILNKLQMQILHALLLLLLLLLLVRLHDQSSSSDEVGGLLQVLQGPYNFW